MSRKPLFQFTFFGLLFVIGLPLAAQTPQEISDQYLQKTPITVLEIEDLAAGYDFQNAFVETLIPSSGAAVGYKAALTNPELQARFGATEPLLGNLLRDMLLPTGATVARNFGARPMLEGDLLVRVGSTEINQAQSIAAVTPCIDAIFPFVELPDLMLEPSLLLTPERIVAINTGARFGVVGDRLEFNDQVLQDLTVQILDANGQEIAQGNLNALGQHPWEIVLWIRDRLQAQGKTLKVGDLLSLGSLTPMMPIPSGNKTEIVYQNAQQQRKITIYFDE